MKTRLLIVSLLVLNLFAIVGCSIESKKGIGKEVVMQLEPKKGNPRNSEGDFIKLNDGRIQFIYTYFTEGAGDNAGAYLAGCYSKDDGKTWLENEKIILGNEGGMNIMSVSLLRLPDNRIAMFYLRKNSKSDCLLYMRTSSDETKSWSEPTRCIPDDGYFVVNNDRVVRLNSGRIIFPAALHKTPESETSKVAKIRCYYSDDEGKTWNRGDDAPNPNNITTQEPGVIELKNGKLMLFCRTDSGSQYLSYSSDQGATWSSIIPSNIKSPLSPASIERIPSTGDLMLVWNNNYEPISNGGNRTPFNIAISNDEGNTWKKIKPIESNPYGWYCYTAIEFVGDHVLLGHCAGNRTKSVGLATTHITRLSTEWIYKEATEVPYVAKDVNGIIELECIDKEAEIFYSLDRKMPHLLYEAPIKISRSSPLWIQALANGKSKSELVSTYVGTDILQPSLNLSSSNGKGLIYEYYESAITTVDDIVNQNIKEKGIIENISIENRMRDTSFAFVFSGYINIPKDGKYTFYLGSNDGSALYLDDYELINNDGAHALIEESAVISLNKGNHKILLKYFQMLGGQSLILSWKGEDFKKTEISESNLFH